MRAIITAVAVALIASLMAAAAPTGLAAATTAQEQRAGYWKSKECIGFGGHSSAGLCLRGVNQKKNGRIASHLRILSTVNHLGNQTCGAFESGVNARLDSYQLSSLNHAGRMRTLHFDPNPRNLDNCKNTYDKTYRTKAPCIVTIIKGTARRDFASDERFALRGVVGGCDYRDSWHEKTSAPSRSAVAVR